MTNRMLELNDGAFAIEIFEAGKGTPLLYLHGAGGHMPKDRFLAALCQHFHVHAPLLPGYGNSTGEENLRDMLDFALLGHDIMDALGLEDQIVVGHSMGGMIAAEMAAIAPHDITRLALIAPAGLWLDEHPIPDLFSKLPFELPELLFHDVELGKELMTAGLDFGDPEFLKSFLVINARRLGTAGKILFPIPERGLSQRLYRIRARTKVIWGESDKLIVPHYADAFVGAIAGAELVLVPDAGHLVTHERPDEVIAAISALS